MNIALCVANQSGDISSVFIVDEDKLRAIADGGDRDAKLFMLQIRNKVNKWGFDEEESAYKNAGFDNPDELPDRYVLNQVVVQLPTEIYAKATVYCDS